MSIKPSKEIKVLHIDDFEGALSLTKTFLRKLSPRMDIKGTTDTKEGIKLILSNQFDVILCDLQLENTKTGIEVFDAIKNSQQWNNTPFILFTSASEKDLKYKALAKGIEYVSKNGDPGQIYTKLNNLIQRLFRRRNKQINGC